MAGVHLAPCHDEFRGPRSDYVRQRMENSQELSKLFNETVEYDTEMNPQYKRYFASNIAGSLATVFTALVAIARNLAVILASFWNEALKVQTGMLHAIIGH
ncbi:hypothetical protein TNCV_3108711 [Trichonephila clavipes]|uniref:Uncharacterized protein n=1 Tax=Trichonephila clavipes TaxID=2585209 RepID=A0A8X6SBC7_TRICX|nr:hypothetical protein TNCV_3108711 [Trichonephila clavipes]